MYTDIIKLKNDLVKVGLSARHKSRLSFRYRFLTGKTFKPVAKKVKAAEKPAVREPSVVS
jgi:hypothetical protein